VRPPQARREKPRVSAFTSADIPKILNLRPDLAPQRVRVNAIAPSATMTERVKKLVAGNAALTRLADSDLLGLIEPDDIASAALYLASEESRMITGQVPPVDSGVTIS
jgi:NAD(P)-dependent dehydrogenase (short-subunit alcohol dehydrogenase family)